MGPVPVELAFGLTLPDFYYNTFDGDRAGLQAVYVGRGFHQFVMCLGEQGTDE